MTEASRSIEEVKSALKYDVELLEEKEREAIHHQMGVLEEAILGNDRDRIDFERERLHECLKRLDDRFCQRMPGSATPGRKPCIGNPVRARVKTAK